jgi:uncharacterized protein YndB with AHSA1/START domain
MSELSGYGVVTEPQTVRLERLLAAPVERVWAFLTESDKRGKWLAPGEMELRVGGKVTLNFLHANLSSEKEVPAKYKAMECGHTMQGVITRCEPPHVLAYTWGHPKDSEVTFELSAQGNKTLLVVTHVRLGSRDNMLSVAAGWHTHVGILEDQLNGVEPRPFWTTHAQLVAEYGRRFADL